ncbi:MAG TPA: hypothetical protein VMT55_00155 [Candidatus Sulfotelmatobacter sp.]|nr:hypothetical protein [Candidatus Sulfotelmatobacter sp.]
MGKISRFNYTPFGGSAAAAANGIEQFGSGRTVPNYTVDPETIIALSAWAQGWNAAIASNTLPFTEDMNAVDFVHGQALAYIFQQGVPEYDSGTTYYTGSMVQSGSRIYVSITDDNIGNPVTDATNWFPVFGNAPVYWGGTDTGGANQIALNIAGYPSNGNGPHYEAAGTTIFVIKNVTNTGAVSISVNAASNLDVVDAWGNPLAGGEMQAGKLYTLVNDEGSWRIAAPETNPTKFWAGGDSGGTNTMNVSCPAWAWNLGTAWPPSGTEVYIVPGHTNTGVVTIKFNNDTGAVVVNKKDGNACSGGELVAGTRYLLAYDDTLTGFRIIA